MPSVPSPKMGKAKKAAQVVVPGTEVTFGELLGAVLKVPVKKAAKAPKKKKVKRKAN